VRRRRDAAGHPVGQSFPGEWSPRDQWRRGDRRAGGRAVRPVHGCHAVAGTGSGGLRVLPGGLVTDRRGPRLSIPGLVALLTALVAVVLGVAALVMRGRLPLVSAAPTVLAIAALVLAVPILLWRGYLFIRD